MTSIRPFAHIQPACPFCDLQRVSSISGAIYASDSFLFKDAFFGRDALEVAEDLLEIYPHIAHHVLLSLAQLQGVRLNSQSEEEAGKIHHEYRSLCVDGRKIDQASQQILHDLSQHWGGTETEVLYYGTVDATPLYVRLIADYCHVYGTDLLNVSYQNRSGKIQTMRESVLSAIEWIVSKMIASDLHLLEFLRMNEQGLAYQDWKDGNLYSHVHSNGDILNVNAPIASVGVQGIAYDALIKSAQLFEKEKPNDAAKWRAMAKDLLQETLKCFWIPKEQFFAMAIDRDPSGHHRQVQTITSDPATLLATGLFDTLEEEEKQEYISAIVRRASSPELITDVGVRCRSLRHKDLVVPIDSQGSWTVWPKETYDIAKGLRRQGLPVLAQQLDMRLLKAVKIAASHAEFFYVHPDGRVCPHPKEEWLGGMPVERMANECIPEETQAWTISAMLAIRHAMAKKQQLLRSHTRWLRLLEEEVLKHVPSVIL